MPVIPGQNVTITDPGVGTSGAAERAFLFLGCSSSGTVDTLYSYTRKSDLIAELGQGPMPEDACRFLDVAGGPVYCMRLTGSVAGASGSVTAAAVGSSTGTITVGVGTAYDSYEVIVEITKTGTGGTAEFKYSLDDGRTYGDEIIVPSGLSYVIPDTGLTITFVPGAGAVYFEDGDTHSFDCTAPLYSTANLATAVTAILATSQAFTVVVLSGEHATSSASATMFAAFATHLTSLETQFRYVRGIMDGGSYDNDRATAITAHAASLSARIALCYGYCDINSSKPIGGWGAPQRSLVGWTAAQIGARKISTDAARTASGPAVGVLAVRDDEARNPLLNAQKFTTVRTWQGEGGFYLTNCWLRAPTNSDFRYFQHGQVMDVACTTVVSAQFPFISKGIRTNEGGTIHPTDKAVMEAKVQSALRAVLKDPRNEEGHKGHVSDFGYSIDDANDLLTSETLLTSTKIRPLAYPKTIEAEIGFSKSV